jgi:DNA polymerase-3 subunit epsilon
MGDAAATVKLLELLFENDREGFISGSLKRSSREAILPPHLPVEVFQNLPEKTGVYYFHDSKGKIIYVGKAINIKKRVVSHFSGTGPSRLSFVSAIADITYEICGTELIALLLESNEIKRLFPLYNQAQKFDRNNYILAEYHDQKNIRHLLFTKGHRNLQPLMHFRSFDAAREYMFRLIGDFELCPKCCGMQSGSGPCFDHLAGKCRGICNETEDVNEYNIRVAEAIQHVKKRLQTRMIIDEGRSYDERSIILIENGEYKGFGYFPSSLELNDSKQAYNIIQPLKHNPDIQRILDGWDAVSGR